MQTELAVEVASPWDNATGAMPQIRAMAERIKAGMACRVILFGSHAWGRPNAQSDVDLAVVVPDDCPHRHPARLAARLSQHGLIEKRVKPPRSRGGRKARTAKLSHGRIIPIDVLWYRESTLDAAVRGSLAYEVKTRGVELGT